MSSRREYLETFEGRKTSIGKGSPEIPFILIIKLKGFRQKEVKVKLKICDSKTVFWKK